MSELIEIAGRILEGLMVEVGAPQPEAGSAWNTGESAKVAVTVRNPTEHAVKNLKVFVGAGGDGIFLEDPPMVEYHGVEYAYVGFPGYYATDLLRPGADLAFETRVVANDSTEPLTGGLELVLEGEPLGIWRSRKVSGPSWQLIAA